MILCCSDQYAVMLIFQAMDAAGKNGAIQHVMSGVNPQGCQVFSFKNPSATELDHDFLWRTGFYPDSTDTSKKPYDRQKECLCRREESIALSSNGVL